MPRMLGEVGNLTKAEQDVYGGSAAVTKRITQAFKSMVNGKLTDDNRNFLLDLVNRLETASKNNLLTTAEQYKLSLKNLRPNLDTTVIDSAFSPFLSSLEQKPVGVLMEDANGNKAMVYPDGRIEEVK
jgi:hypothetical protein